MCLMNQPQVCKDCGRTFITPIRLDLCFGCAEKPPAPKKKPAAKKITR